MKKNLWFKLGLFCTALVLVATCFITSAWAKYTKTVSATDSARVAKFVVDMKQGGETITDGQTIDIFTTKLDNIYVDENGNNVNGDKLIAPGSHGSFKITVENTSEVAVSLEITGSLSNTEVPLVFSTTEEGTYTSLDQLTISEENVPATAEASTKTYTIYWKWNSVSDADDTKLGTSTSSITVTASIKLVVEQVLTTK